MHGYAHTRRHNEGVGCLFKRVESPWVWQPQMKPYAGVLCDTFNIISGIAIGDAVSETVKSWTALGKISNKTKIQLSLVLHKVVCMDNTIYIKTVQEILYI